MRNVTFLTVLLCLLLSPLVGAQDTLWTRTYGGSEDDGANCVRETNDGGYIVVGTTGSFGAGGDDIYLLKTDAEGDTVWTRTYGGGADDRGACVEQTTDGGYIIGATSWSYGPGERAMYVLKTDASGDTLWTRTYGEDRNWLAAIEQTDDGGYIMVGITYGLDKDFYIVKTDSTGNVQWTRTYSGASVDWAFSVQQTTDGGYIIAGITSSFGAGHYDFWLMKTDSGGDTLWTKTYGGIHEDGGRSVEQTSDGGYVVAGYTTSFGAGDYDFYLVRTDSIGGVIWTRTYGGSSTEIAESVRETDDGGFVVAGYTSSFGAGDFDYYLVRTDSVGDTLWTRTYGGSGDDRGICCRQTSDEGYIVAGWSGSFGAGGYDFYLVRVGGERLVEMSCEPIGPWFCRGTHFAFKITVTNNSGGDVTGPLTFAGYTDYDCDPAHTLVTITRTRTYPPGLTEQYYRLKVPNFIAPGRYSASVGGSLSGTEVFCCMNTDIVQCGPWRSCDNTKWELVEVDALELESSLPASASLSQCHPNPFNLITLIEYQLPEASEVRLKVYNVLGEEIATLVNGHEEAGYKSVTWDASEVSSGIYFYRLTAADHTETKRMMLVK